MKKVSIIMTIILISLLSILSCKNKEISSEKKHSIENTVDIKPLTSMSLEVGDPIDIVLIIKSKKDSKINYPEKDELFNPFLLQSYQVKQKIKNDEKIIYIYYTLTTYYSGKLVLPPLTIKIDEKPIKTRPIEIKIKSTISSGKRKDINDIVGPLKNRRFFILITLSLLIIFLIILFYREKLSFLRKRKRVNVKYDEKNITYDPVLTSLLNIFIIKNDTELSVKDKYYILSNSLKKVLGVILKINIMPLTTNRIKSILYKYIPGELYNYLVRKFNKYDEVKYSKRIFNREYKKELIKNFSGETNNLLKFLYQLIKKYYREMIEIVV